MGGWIAFYLGIQGKVSYRPWILEKGLKTEREWARRRGEDEAFHVLGTVEAKALRQEQVCLCEE